jgi:hypothetical protein
MKGTIVAKMVKAAVLFVVFGIISVAFWGYFHPRVRRWFSRLAHRFSLMAHR